MTDYSFKIMFGMATNPNLAETKNDQLSKKYQTICSEHNEFPLKRDEVHLERTDLNKTPWKRAHMYGRSYGHS